MTQTPIPIDKTLRIPVKLVTTAGDELPFEGLMLVPKDRLTLLENLATAARNHLLRGSEAVGNTSKVGEAEAAKKALEKAVSGLKEIWDIPT